MSPSTVQLVNFLGTLFEQGLSYSAINTAKAAVLTYVNSFVGDNNWDRAEILKRFMRGVFLQRPSLPKYSFTWDVDRVLRYLKQQSPPQALTLLSLSRKLVTLILLISGQRGQALHLLDHRNVQVEEDKIILRFGDLQKQSRPGFHVGELILPAYPMEQGLCVRNTYLAYIKRTKPLRRCTALFITTQRPHGRATRDTLSRWVKQVLQCSGVDLSVFSPHSIRGAATSAAAANKVPLATILKTAGWSQENTFRAFYHRPVTRDHRFVEGVLGQGPIGAQSTGSGGP